jgi:PAS domain-containing protein
LIRSPTWENPRAHLLDDMWLMTIIAILVATAIPWFVGGLQVDLGTAGAGLAALGGIQVGFAALASPTRSPWRGRDLLLTVLDVIGVVVIGFIWKHVGALQNPLFLAIFALPVIGSIFLSRWHPYLVAAVSVLVVGAVALSEAPELRWYASGLFAADAKLDWLLGGRSTVAQSSSSAFYAPPSYLLVMLEVFTIMLLACAVAAEYVGSIFDRLSALTVISRTEAERGQELWTSLIERLPVPALLVDPPSQRIIAASQLATTTLQGEETTLEGRNMFEALQFSYPETIQELLVGPDGTAPMIVMRVARLLRVVQIRALHVAHKGRRLALLTLEDTTETFCLRAALDTSEYAALIIDAEGRILAFNRPAAGLFVGMEIGAPATRYVPQAEGKLSWWDPGLTRRRKMHIEIGPRIYQVTSAAIQLAGEDESIFSASFLPVAAGAPGEPMDTSATVSTGTLRQLR